MATSAAITRGQGSRDDGPLGCVSLSGASWAAIQPLSHRETWPSIARVDARSWALLVRPSANRVYAASAPQLLVAETAVLDATVLNGRLDDPAVELLGGVPYVTFASDGDLDERDVGHLSTLSGAYALFRRDDSALRPVDLRPLQQLDEDLLTIQKYVGKTNELFTRLLFNVTVWASASGRDLVAGANRERPIRVLDPLCGRGSTLHQALVYGCDADGLDVDARDFDAHEAFLKTWLRRKRLKHSAEVVPIRRDGERLGRRLEVTLGVDKEAWKVGDVRRLGFVHADTRRAGEFFRPATFDALVADAPYGVQHGARAGGRLERNPLHLLQEALPGWVSLLRPGAALGIAWNTRVAPREDAVGLLTQAGLEPLDDGPWRGFLHRVDQAIERDIVVARIPAAVP
ncbi:SAM-dependent methyltransferase [soil metagenome]